MERFMLKAVSRAYEGIKKGEGGPFGACIVKNGKILALANNTVLKNKDATCHAEINAIRSASRKLNSWNLEGCKIYSTAEPCPMCFAAIHWSRIGEVFYGAGINDAVKAGFNELKVSNEKIKKAGKLKIKINKNFMRRECLKLFKEWSKLGASSY